jgi:hypothetical protein
MDLTSWAVIALLSIIGGGVWSAGTKITDLGFAITTVKANDSKQDEVNQRQDTAISRLEVTLAKQQGYLEQILEAVRSGERRMTR